MNTSQPIRNLKELERFRSYYIKKEYQPRNHALLTLGLNTALRISDILTLRWKDVYDFDKRAFRDHITLIEQKTNKSSQIYMNKSIVKALKMFQEFLTQESPVTGERFVLEGANKGALSRIQAWRIIKKAAENSDISGVISPHSMRKTFGYQAWKQGTPPALLMDIFQHSSFDITRRYLGIEQDDRDEVFRNICI